MRIMTYNIHGWKGMDGQVDLARLARVIARADVDIVGLNEVFHPFVPPGEKRPALEQLADDLGLAYAFGPALMPQFAFAPQSSYGNAVLARRPLLAHASHHLIPVVGHEQRGLLEARILLSDERTALTVYVTHLDHRSEQVRGQQLSALLQWTGRDRALPHLLMGDFNALSPNDYTGQPEALEGLRHQAQLSRLVAEGTHVVPRILKARYVDACAHCAGGKEPSFPTQEPLVRIDYVFVSQPLAHAIVSCGRWAVPEAALASDHYPVVVELAL